LPGNEEKNLETLGGGGSRFDLREWWQLCEKETEKEVRIPDF
jgi:hypothetical protein